MKEINLLDYRWDKHTSLGNDGVIRYILKTIGIEKGLFVEFGAWDGKKNSNCRKLFKGGWDGIFIEGDRKRCGKLKKNYIKHKHIICLKFKVECRGKNEFDNIMKKYAKKRKIDFCSIDIDGLDLEVFETFKKYLPTVVCIEGGQMLHPFHRRVDRSIAKRNIQQSLKVMTDSFEKKGYKLLCAYQDSFFIKEEFYNFFNVSDDLLTLYFDGLRAIPRRMPFIQKYMKKVKLKNKIVDHILDKSDYSRYGWGKRKLWAKECDSIISKEIDKAEAMEKKEYGKY